MIQARFGKALTLAAGAVLAMAAPQAASANIIQVDAGDIGQSYTINYDGFSDGNVINGLTGQTTFTLTGVTANRFDFNYDVRNTSTDPIDTSRISIFGFNTDPNINGATATGLFNQISTGNAPSGLGAIDVCFKGQQGGACAGGGGVGVQAGASTSGTFSLSFVDALDSLTLSNFFVRYQSITGAGNVTSAVGRGTVGGSTGGGSTGGGSTGGTPVPAPAAFALFGLAAAGLVGRRTRRT